jgi:hypothetical protein
MGVGNDHVEKLIISVETHNTDIVKKMRVVVFQLSHRLIENNGAIWVINGAITTTAIVSNANFVWLINLHNKLGNISDVGLIAAATELCV